ncbi:MULTISPECIES: hypothetical protein [Siminovitchia]|uniref:Uncharacterized protein n=1 Tax=Siminovitchia terrae TaxID=1914933 RepID=A0A429X3V1_SIMTE|nr:MULTISPECIES: hypothetical protein [Siminovitchia]RST58067.1 hypothetical protein D5F11_019145 [Siminovitchia terrae]GIN91595.1 hypothetical protein J22TS1_26460 [Siminovitchia terrae]GIN95685.1 hypothetical protein J6TS1_15550 [Siminovitchia terrae]
MGLKKLTIPQRLSIIVTLIIVVASFLISSKIYFNSKEISALSEGCLDLDGEIAVEMTFFNLDYSFSCEK